MDPILLGVVGGLAGLGLLASLSSRSSSVGESYGHHLPPDTVGFRHVKMDGPWDVYEYTGRTGSFLVAMFPDAGGRYPYPSRTNMEYVYPDGVEARVVRAVGPFGKKWSDLDIPGPHSYDLFVYHPANHPGDFPVETSFGAVSGWMGGRGPGAGTGLSAGGGGRHVANSYDWSGVVSSGGFRRWRNPDEDLVVPGEAPSRDEEGWDFGDDGRIEDDDTGQVWSPRFGWVSPAEGESYGINILGIEIPTSKAERVEKLERKIASAEQKLVALEEDAKQDGADIEKLAKQIASIQTQKERWEDKKNSIEIRMGEESFGIEQVDELEDDDLAELDDVVDDELLADLG